MGPLVGALSGRNASGYASFMPMLACACWHWVGALSWGSPGKGGCTTPLHGASARCVRTGRAGR